MMLASLVAVTSALVGLASAAQVQVPFVQSAGVVERKTWDTPPDADETGHFIFDSVVNLLKHWSNAYHRNGHNVVPAYVTPGTLVYHGRGDDRSPTTPEWLSLDPEHSLIFTNRGNSGNMFTYAATRPLKLLYFDGASAYNLRSGTLDTQDVVIYGNVSTGRWNPFGRIVDLCDWGKEYGVDGFLRMEFDFEIMYCNFTNGLEIVSSVNVVPVTWRMASTDLQLDSHHLPLLSDETADPPPYPTSTTRPRWPGGGGGGPGRRPQVPPDPPKGWEGSLRSSSQAVFEALHAGFWHNFAPLTGITLDYSGLLTFFDPKYTSLVRARRDVGDPKLFRLLNISSEDGTMFKKELAEVVTRKDVKGSGVHWGNVMRHIQERYADRLEFLKYLLQSADEDKDASSEKAVNLTSLIFDTREQVLTMLSPFLARDTVPSDPETASTNRTWLEPAMQLCSASYTKYMDTSTFTPQEHILKSAVDATAREICRTLGLIWLTAFTSESVTSPQEQKELLSSWRGEVERLMNWLDWAVWLKCRPGCGEDEICTQPQWPFDGVRSGTEEATPRCVSRLRFEQRRPGPGGPGPGGPGGPDGPGPDGPGAPGGPGGPGEGGPPGAPEPTKSWRGAW